MNEIIRTERTYFPDLRAQSYPATIDAFMTIGLKKADSCHNLPDNSHINASSQCVNAFTPRSLRVSLKHTRDSTDCRPGNQFPCRGRPLNFVL